MLQPQTVMYLDVPSGPDWFWAHTGSWAHPSAVNVAVSHYNNQSESAINCTGLTETTYEPEC